MKSLIYFLKEERNNGFIDIYEKLKINKDSNYIPSKENVKAKEIALQMIKSYFGGELPKDLSSEGMKCDNDEDIYKLIENIELYIMSDECQDNIEYDEKDVDDIHLEIIDWVKTHNK